MFGKTFLNDPIKALSVNGLGPLGGALALGGIGAVTGLIGADKAADAASDASAANIAFQKWLWGEQQKTMAPFISGGTAGMEAYMQALGFTKQPTTGTAPVQQTSSGVTYTPTASGSMIPSSGLSYGPALGTASYTSPYTADSGVQRTVSTNRVMSQDEADAYINTIGAVSYDQRNAAAAAARAGENPYEGMRTRTAGAQPQAPMQDAGPGYEWVGPSDPLADPEFYFKEFNFEKGDLYQDPSYKFRFEQGQEALQSSALADAGLLRGSTAKALSDYGQESASQEYSRAYGRAFDKYTKDRAMGFDVYREKFDRRQTMLNNLWQLAQGGMNAAVGAGSSSNVLGQQVGQSYSDLGNIGAASAAGQMNAIGSGIGLGLKAYDVFS